MFERGRYRSPIDTCHFTYDDARLFIERYAYEVIEQKYPAYVMPFDKNLNKSGNRFADVMFPRIGPIRYNVYIQTSELEEGKRLVNGVPFVRDIDFLWSLKHIYHESRHLDLALKMRKSKTSESDKPLMMFDATCSVFKGFYDKVYLYAPHELDAEIFAFDSVVEAVKSDFVGEDGKPIFDAKQLLFEGMKEYSWKRFEELGRRDGLFVKNYDEALELLRDNMVHWREEPCPIVVKGGRNGEIDYSGVLKKTSKWASVFDAKNTIGPIYYEAMFLMAMDVNSIYGEFYPDIRRLRKEIRAKHPEQKIDIQNRINGALEQGAHFYPDSGCKHKRHYDDIFDY